MQPKKIVLIQFYRSASGNEPVRDWLKSLSKKDKRIIGQDLKTVEMGWPIGMPLVRSLEGGLWEVRSSLSQGIARIVFNMKNGKMILLHSFIKKTQKTNKQDLDLAKKKKTNIRQAII